MERMMVIEMTGAQLSLELDKRAAYYRRRMSKVSKDLETIRPLFARARSEEDRLKALSETARSYGGGVHADPVGELERKLETYTDSLAKVKFYLAHLSPAGKYRISNDEVVMFGLFQSYREDAETKDENPDA